MKNEISVPKGAWLIVADHSKALLLKNNGTAVAPLFEVRQVLDAPENPPTREQGTSRPGRAFSGSHRSAVEQTDWHTVAGRQFLENVAEAVHAAISQEKIEAIILVAPPKALADLREAISDEAKARLVGTLDKDLTGMPVGEIEKHFIA